jgi:hypothetical protein
VIFHQVSHDTHSPVVFAVVLLSSRLKPMASSFVLPSTWAACDGELPPRMGVCRPRPAFQALVVGGQWISAIISLLPPVMIAPLLMLALNVLLLAVVCVYSLVSFVFHNVSL